MTKSPSPSVDEVAGLRDAVIGAIERLYVPTSRPTYGDMIEAVTSAFDASLVSPPKAGSGEPVAWMIPDWGTVYGKAGFRYLTSEQTRTSRDDWEDGEYDAFLVAMKDAVPLYANHEARGDGVRVKPLEWTNEVLEGDYFAIEAQTLSWRNCSSAITLSGRFPSAKSALLQSLRGEK